MLAQNDSRRRDLIATYIEPLRSAIFIDDQFPRYEDLLARAVDSADTPPAKSYDTASIERLLAACRSRALMCDIENEVQRVLKSDHLSHVLKSDLVVLDYHLTPGNDSDPLAALEVVSRLASSPHANLVVVYTRGELRDALLELAVRFRGIDYATAYDDDVAADLAEWEPEIDSALRHALVCGDTRLCKTLTAQLRKELDDLHIVKSRQTHAINVRLETWLRERYAHVNAPRSVVRRHLEMSADGADVLWLSCDNVFVTFVKKGPDTDIFKKLEEALVAWNPSAIRVLLARARTDLEQGGFEYELTAAGTAEWQIGVLYHVLAGEEPDIDIRLAGLFGRLFEALQRELTTKLSDFGRRLLEQEIGKIPAGPPTSQQEQAQLMSDARKLSRTGDRTKTEDVLLFLNAFLCSTPFHGSHVQTGTVFRDVSTNEWWLCVTPGCELVPRPPSTGTWQHELHPCLPAFALRLSPQTAHSALPEATVGKSIFILASEETVALRVVDANTKQPVPVMFLLANEGRTDAERQFSAYAAVRSSSSKEGVPSFQLRSFQAVAQLRHEYADRLLQMTGHHTSRIGVDFVDVRLDKPSVT